MSSLEFFILAILTCIRWNLSVVLICVFLVAKSIEHFFRCLLAIRESSVETSLFGSVPQCLIGLFGLLVFDFLSSLHILDICPLSDIGLMKTFSHFVGCHFVLLMVSLAL